MSAVGRSERGILTLGVVVLAAYLIQGIFGLELSWLARLQSIDTYKVMSGLLVAGYLGFQWSIALRHPADHARALYQHKIAGALAPLVLYLHATRFAYGYLFLLSLVYLGTASLGLLSRPVVKRHIRWLYTVWFVVHVSTSVLLVVLGAYHVVIALAYE